MWEPRRSDVHAGRRQVSAGRFWFVGDVHGRADLLERLLAAVTREEDDPRIVFLGDVVDRGPDSRACMDLVKGTLSTYPGSKLLLGNHDDMFLVAMRNGVEDASARHWRDRCGGGATLESYGLSPDAYIPAAADRINEFFADHLEMLRTANLLLTFGAFVAAHAGINPMLPLDAQDKLDLTWIRDGFLDHVSDRLRPVIHGHSITENEMPVMTENRISLDTGAFYSGRLTCLKLDLDERSLNFFQARTDGFVEVQPEVHHRGRGTLMDRLDDLFEAPSTSSQRI
jgi:serine/threonine protein phosphatase 1